MWGGRRKKQTKKHSCIKVYQKIIKKKFGGGATIRALGRNVFFYGNARPESNAHVHLKQRKNIVVYAVNNVKYFFLNLKGLAQAKIIKKSVILFWLHNMTIWCKHVHRLELQKFLNFSAAHSSVRLDIETKFPYF